SNLFFTATFAIPKALKADKLSGLFDFWLVALLSAQDANQPTARFNSMEQVTAWSAVHVRAG
ncbi:MAG: hypothetical protein Q8S49_16315, partial [Pseudomonas sp.]|nr:hypothetical protein [Pseudomonas sp.]